MTKRSYGALMMAIMLLNGCAADCHARYFECSVDWSKVEDRVLLPFLLGVLLWVCTATWRWLGRWVNGRDEKIRKEIQTEDRRWAERDPNET
jgi:hypothetical protein